MSWPPQFRIILDSMHDLNNKIFQFCEVLAKEFQEIKGRLSDLEKKVYAGADKPKDHSKD